MFGYTELKSFKEDILSQKNFTRERFSSPIIVKAEHALTPTLCNDPPSQKKAKPRRHTIFHARPIPTNMLLDSPKLKK